MSDQVPLQLDHRRRRWRRTNLVVGALIVGTVVATALLSFVWTPYDPTAISGADALLPSWSPGHPMGTDAFGRDVLSQLMVGARSALFVGVLAVSIAVLIGVPVGGFAAARRGWVEDAVMRLADVIYAFPAVLGAILLVAALEPGIGPAMIAIGVAYVPIVARVTRGASLRVLELDFVTAARSYGRTPSFIFIRHVLPNIASVLIVQATVLFALAILAEAALSFLGIGTQPPDPSWGRSLRDAQTLVRIAPGLALWPGAAIALTVLGFNLLGDGLRDALDPRLEVDRS
ncbi:MAG: ABC transporter permease [Acidimicrobiia bacterium]|jgi:peptide/nickel transport system permease protein|nr:MAG: ABC transporter permease [Acidimicrobiia bacterium]